MIYDILKNKKLMLFILIGIIAVSIAFVSANDAVRLFLLYLLFLLAMTFTK